MHLVDVLLEILGHLGVFNLWLLLKLKFPESEVIFFRDEILVASLAVDTELVYSLFLAW